MNKNIFIKLTICLIACAVFALGMAFAIGAESKPADVDYYTCTMHPSVKLQDPHAKCPICGMDLVPVKKKSEPGVTNTASTGTGTNAEAEQPSEFAVPLERQQQIGVTYAAVERRPLAFTIRAFGTVAFDKQRQWDYAARVDGYVEKLGVFSPGEVVEKGAPLLTIYSPAMFTAEKEFVDALKMRDEAQAKQSADILKSAEQLLESGRERLRLWNITEDQIAALARTRQPEETLTLFSPFKGVVEELGVDQGRRVAAGDRLVEVADFSIVWVWAQFYQDELAMLKMGLPVTVTTSSGPGKKFSGKIVLMDPFVSDTLRTGRVRIDVDNPDFKLWPGMYVDVELSIDNGTGLTVPVGAVLPTGLHNIAFVDKGRGRLEPRFIEIGRKYGDFYEVESGLNENERIVTSANFLIDAEAKVQGALKAW